MKLRFRFFATLLALVGLLAVSVQGAWAASCAASMGPEHGAPSVSGGTEAHLCSAEVTASRAGGSELPDGSGSGAPSCPSMPMSATSGCGAVLALPAVVSPHLASFSSDARLSPRTDSAHELLLAAAFFRPPIA